MRNEFTDRQIEIMELASLIIDRDGIQELTIKNLAAEINLSEAALYRHFKSKSEIMLGLLDYFMLEMKDRVTTIAAKEGRTASQLLKDIFTSQLKIFAQKPAIVSVIFSEGIFQFNKELMKKISAMMEMMQGQIDAIVKRGQQEGSFRDFVGPSTVSTIIMGSMRMAVMKWKVFGRNSDLVKDGTKVLNGVLKMIEKSNEN
ncbi:MAG: TetR/AcrR family transcriptional regulator [Niastella sp.]|nr:TetR/AcrR family transcriptional regulator [Niastella sp.]